MIKFISILILILTSHSIYPQKRSAPSKSDRQDANSQNTKRSSSSSQESLVGTFYGGWARNKGDYVWIRDFGKEAQFHALGDVNGDGYEDAISARKGKWEVALSETYTNPAGREVRHFGKKVTWAGRFIAGPGNSMKNGIYMVGDLNGDSKTDIAIFEEKTGNWEFAISKRNAFETIDVAISGFGTHGNQPFLKDVNGDSRSDAIIYDAGTWKVCLNKGNSFDVPRTFISGFGSASAQTFIADVNGDGKGDAVYYENGNIYVALSDGLNFISPAPWLTGITATEVIFGDASGDNIEDVILFHMRDAEGRNSGKWEICQSNGNNAFAKPELWCNEHGSGDRRNRITKTIPEAHKFMLGHVEASKESGHGASCIAINNKHGFWQVMPPKSLLNGITSAKWYNSWQTWNRASLPRIGDQYYGFDADEDTFAIAEIIKELAAVEIDYVMLDQTNSWNFLIKSYRLFANEIDKWNRIPGNRKVRYAICGKGWKPGGAKDVEESARNSMEEFVNHPVYGSAENYQYVDGKPLLVIYGDGERKDNLWADFKGDKTFAKQFTLKWMDGHLYPEGMDPDNKGNWYGWALVNGSYENAEQMVVQPGFFNHASFASRFEHGIEGDRYRKLNWDKVLLNKPNKVTIISLVADMEQNDIYTMRTGDFPEEMGRTEHWSYPEMYWEMTRDYIKNYRMLRRGEIQHIAEYGTEEIHDKEIKITFTLPFPEPPVIYACIQGNPGTDPKLVKVSDVKTGTFVMKVSGINPAVDKINWYAMLPGQWKTPNGMKMAAGKTRKKDGIDLRLGDNPAVFSMLNEKSHTWIAIETGKKEMWSGRFSTAMKLEVRGQNDIEYKLPRYFYDKTITLVNATNDALHPLVIETTNLGGKVKYQRGDLFQSDTINIFNFDGGGGCLYGSALETPRTNAHKRN